jgi:plasmid stabilization system protein ParE
MEYLVVLSEEASKNIDDNVEWWSRKRSAEQAERWYSGIREAIASLSVDPQRCPLAPESCGMPGAVRELHFGLEMRPTHRVLFTTLPRTVVVLAVRHAAQDEFRQP